MQDTAKLSLIAQAEIDLLVQDGVDVTPSDIVRINALAWNIDSPETRLALAKGIPVAVGGATLWPLTLQAYDWYERVGCTFTNEEDAQDALAYAMAHCYGDDATFNVVGGKARRAAIKFRKRLRCTRKELLEAISQVTRQEENEPIPPDPEGKELALGDLSALLCAMSGIPAEEFERRMSMNHALRVLHYTMMKQAQASGASATDDSHIRAEIAMGLYIHGVRERHKNKMGTANE